MTEQIREFSKELILETALELAAKQSWEAVKLYEVAEALEAPLNQIAEHFKQKDDIAEALFDRADEAMRALGQHLEFLNLSHRERMEKGILVWLETLQPHRPAVRQMMAYKLEFGHVHLQAHGITRISRTVQWLLETVRYDATQLRRVIEESVLTSIFVSTYSLWLCDLTGPDLAKRHLNRTLMRAEGGATRLQHWLP